MALPDLTAIIISQLPSVNLAANNSSPSLIVIAFTPLTLGREKSSNAVFLIIPLRVHNTILCEFTNSSSFKSFTSKIALTLSSGGNCIRFCIALPFPVFSLGRISDDDLLAQVYAAADVFVLPSLQENLANTAIEAMACGTPVAAYPCQGPIDVIDQNLTGFMHLDLKQAVDQALLISRQTVYENSFKWSWENTWQIFKNNLTKI